MTSLILAPPLSKSQYRCLHRAGAGNIRPNGKRGKKKKKEEKRGKKKKMIKSKKRDRY